MEGSQVVRRAARGGAPNTPIPPMHCASTIVDHAHSHLGVKKRRGQAVPGSFGCRDFWPSDHQTEAPMELWLRHSHGGFERVAMRTHAIWGAVPYSLLGLVGSVVCRPEWTIPQILFLLHKNLTSVACDLWSAMAAQIRIHAQPYWRMEGDLSCFSWQKSHENHEK